MTLERNTGWNYLYALYFMEDLRQKVELILDELRAQDINTSEYLNDA